MDEQPLTIDSPAVQAVKARFEKHKDKRKITLTFEELFDLFITPEATPISIAKRGGVSVQAVGKMYDAFFRDLFGDESVMERRARCMRKKASAKIKEDAVALLSEGVVGTVVANARAAGCDVTAIEKRKKEFPTGLVRNEILVNGHRCGVRHLHARWRPNNCKRWFTRLVLYRSTLSEMDAVLFRTTVKGYPKHTFVVPSTRLLAAYFASGNKPAVWITIPLEKRRKNQTVSPRLAWWQYENAWHLLPMKHTAPVST